MSLCRFGGHFGAQNDLTIDKIDPKMNPTCTEIVPLTPLGASWFAWRTSSHPCPGRRPELKSAADAQGQNHQPTAQAKITSRRSRTPGANHQPTPWAKIAGDAPGQNHRPTPQAKITERCPRPKSAVDVPGLNHRPVPQARISRERPRPKSLADAPGQNHRPRPHG